MRHQYEGHTQRYRQKPQNLADKFVNLIQRAHPFGVHRGRFDHRQPDQIAVQRLYLRRSRRRVGCNDKYVGQRIAVEHRYQVLIEAGLQLLQPLLLADKADFGQTRVALQQVLHRVVVRLRCAGFHIHGNLRRFVELAQHALSALHAQIQRQRQGHRHRQHRQRQQGTDRLAQELSERGAGGFHMQRNIMNHAHAKRPP